MTKQEFTSKLKELGLSVVEFSDMVGLNPASVRSFNDEKRPIPQWIDSWIELYEKSKCYTELKEKIFEIEKIEA
ncbi:hypothetical protein [Campylobacter sp. 7477a]|uniref:hypothetical protein n=1 Tax=Campylobacter sp. 7477a TaxID=2735741 RepID=UPI0030154F5A|nr:hypothetical protein [Campylobacter sp. 7477a]